VRAGVAPYDGPAATDIGQRPGGIIERSRVVDMERLKQVVTKLVLLASLIVAPNAVNAQEATPVPYSPGTDLAALSGAIEVAGSATVGPAVEAAADAFAEQAPDVEVAVERSSSGAGLERFCAGETDIATSGRPINEEETAACAANDVAYNEFEVAFDGVVVVVNPAVDFFTCLTVEQLGRLWAPDSDVATWADLDPGWPAEPIALYGTGEDSGTYQFFTQVVTGEEGVSRDDYTVTDGHPATADGVAEDENGLGFLPYPRYVENQERLTLVEVDGGEGCVAPSPETIRDGSYAPLSRPLYVYVKRESLERPEVAEFLRFYFADAGGFAEEAGIVPLDDAAYAANQAELDGALAGSTPPDGPDLEGTPAS
jgi:phosphate transport system substrate-binding protein